MTTDRQYSKFQVKNISTKINKMKESLRKSQQGKGFGQRNVTNRVNAYIILVNFPNDIFKVKIIKTLFLTGLLELINGN